MLDHHNNTAHAVGEDCAYCGMPADTRDHVVPYLYSGVTERIHITPGSAPGETVPACRDCNNTLSSKLFKTFEERRRHVADRLEKRHRRLLNLPRWSEDDLEEMGPALLKSIKASQAEARIIRFRINVARYRLGPP